MFACMKGLEHPPYLQLYIMANVLATVLLVAAMKRPTWARWGFVLLFAWAAGVNATTSMRAPAVYLEYADLTFLPVYRSVILGAFSAHIAFYVGSIAFCQALIAMGLLVGGRLAPIATWGGMAFLVAIAPFGVGSGFPCTLLFAAGLFVLLRKGMSWPAWRSLAVSVGNGTRTEAQHSTKADLRTS